jgi:hypothetical protein
MILAVPGARPERNQFMWHVPGREVGVASGQKGSGAFVRQLEMLRCFVACAKVATGVLLSAGVSTIA